MRRAPHGPEFFEPYFRGMFRLDIPHGVPRAVQFSMIGRDEKRAFYELVNSKGDRSALEHELDSTKFGVIYRDEGQCDVCHGTVGDGASQQPCPGHFYHVNLASPIFHPLMLTKLAQILSLFCPRCGKLKVYARFEGNPRGAQQEVLRLRSQLPFLQYIPSLYRLYAETPCCEQVTIFKGDEAKGEMRKISRDRRDVGVSRKATEAAQDIGGERGEKVKPEDVQEMLARIKRDRMADLRLIGLDMAPPESLVIQSIQIAPRSIRPTVRDSARNSYDQLTEMYAELCSKVFSSRQKAEEQEEAGDVKADTRKAELEDASRDIFTAYRNIISTKKGGQAQTGSAPRKGIFERFQGKYGRLRNNLMGKRVNYCSRSVIDCDPTISIDELGVPRTVAMKLTYPEVVTHRNVDFLQRLVNNGNNYPGATKITLTNGMERRLDVISASPGSSGNSEGQSASITLELGSVVHRHMLDGDYIIFNRQPSLHKLSFNCHRVKVMPYSVFRVNLSDCSVYNADCDGDEMNLHVPQHYEATAEMASLMLISGSIVSVKNNSPVITVVQDSLLGSYFLTRRDTFITPERMYDYAMWVTYSDDSYRTSVRMRRYKQSESTFLGAAGYHEPLASGGPSLDSSYGGSNTSFGDDSLGQDVSALAAEGNELETRVDHPILPGSSGLTGAVCRSKQTVLTDLPEPAICFPAPTWTGKQLFSMFLPSGVNYDLGNVGEVMSQKESYLKILDGSVLSGVCAKSAVGGKQGGLLHALFKDFSSEACKTFLDNCQRCVTHYMRDHSFSVGFGDMLLSPQARQQVDETQAALVRDIQREFRRSAHREIRLAPGQTQEEAFEQAVLTRITTTEEKLQSIVWSDQTYRNGLVCMITAGSKGGRFNMMQISAALAQQKLQQKRLGFKFTTQRSLPHYPPFMFADLESRGYVFNSFIKGLRPSELFFHAVGGREGVCDTAVKTADSGYIERKLMKNMESVGVQYDGTVRNDTNEIIQLKYGDDGLDPHKVEEAPYDGVVLSDKEVAARWYMDYEAMLQEAREAELRSSSSSFGGDALQPERGSGIGLSGSGGSARGVGFGSGPGVSAIGSRLSSSSAGGEEAFGEFSFSSTCSWGHFLDPMRSWSREDTHAISDARARGWKVEAVPFVRPVGLESYEICSPSWDPSFTVIVDPDVLSGEEALDNISWHVNRLPVTRETLDQYSAAPSLRSWLCPRAIATLLEDPGRAIGTLRQEYLALLLERRWFQKLYLRFSSTSTSRPVSMDIHRIVRNAATANRLGRPILRSDKENLCTVDPLFVVSRVNSLLAKIKAFADAPTRLLRVLLRQELSSKILCYKYRLSKESVTTIVNLIWRKFLDSQISPGEPVGPLAGHSVSEPATQLTLNTFHTAGASGLGSLGLPRLKELLDFRDSKVPVTHIYLCHGGSDSGTLTSGGDSWRVQEARGVQALTKAEDDYRYMEQKRTILQMAARLEAAHFSDFVSSMQIVFDPDDRNSVVPGDREWLGALDDIGYLDINGCVAGSPISDSLSPYVLRYELSLRKLQEKAGAGFGIRKLVRDLEKLNGCAPEALVAGPEPPAGNGEEEEENAGQDGLEAKDRKYRYLYYTGIGTAVIRIRPVLTPMETAILNSAAADLNQDPFAPWRCGQLADELYQLDVSLRAHAVCGNPNIHKVFMAEANPVVYYDRELSRNPEVQELASGDPQRRLEFPARVGGVHAEQSGKKSGESSVQEFMERYLQTEGSDLRWVLNQPGVDFTRTYCNSVKEVYHVLGVEAARTLLVREMRATLSSVPVNLHHYLMLSDIMMSRPVDDKLVGINRHGMKLTNTGVISQATFEQPGELLLQAGAFGIMDPLGAVSSSVVMGRSMRYGTGAFELALDCEGLPDALDDPDKMFDSSVWKKIIRGRIKRVDASRDAGALELDGAQLSEAGFVTPVISPALSVMGSIHSAMGTVNQEGQLPLGGGRSRSEARTSRASAQKGRVPVGLFSLTKNSSISRGSVIASVLNPMSALTNPGSISAFYNGSRSSAFSAISSKQSQRHLSQSLLWSSEYNSGMSRSQLDNLSRYATDDEWAQRQFSIAPSTSGDMSKSLLASRGMYNSQSMVLAANSRMSNIISQGSAMSGRSAQDVAERPPEDESPYEPQMPDDMSDSDGSDGQW